MSDQTVNIPLLRKAVEWAEAEAAKGGGQWDQWHLINPEPVQACGTAYCVAGWTLHVAGFSDRRILLGEYEEFDSFDRAADMLGIPRWVAADDEHLFAASNTIADVRRIAEDLAGERL